MLGRIALSRSFVCSFALSCLLMSGLCLGAESGAAAELPYELRSELESLLNRKVSALLDEKNAEGQPFKRAIFSRNFKKVDDATYQVAFHRDTASADKLLVERLLLTLKRAPSGKWEVASEEVKDSYNELNRPVAGDEDFMQFSSFNFDREGMKITASNGSLFKDYRAGKTERIVLVSKRIAYEYSPAADSDPKGAGNAIARQKFALLYQRLKKDQAADVLFTPEYIEIDCDPVTCEDLLQTAFTKLAPASQESVDAKLRDKYNEAQKELKKARKENVFGDFLRPEDPDHRAYRIGLEQDAPKRGVAIAYDNWEPNEVSYWAYNLDKGFPSWSKVYHYASEETRKNGVDPYELERRDDPYARDYDLVGLSGTVEMAIEEAETLSADLVYKLKTKRELREIPFFIARLRQTESEKKDIKDPQLSVNSIEDGNGREMTWVKSGPYGGIVVLPEKVPAGTPVTLHMQFANKAGIYAVTPTFSYVSRFGWMPFVRFTDMIHEFDLTIKVPGRYKTLGIGRKVSETVEKGVRVTRWVSDSPVEFPSVIFGDYIEAASSVKAVKSDGTTIPVTIHVDKLGKMEGAQKYLQDIADQAAFSLNLYSKIFGVDYPYGKLDLVNDPFGAFYGQSPSSLIYLGNGVFLSSGTAGALLESGRISKFNREVVPHEVGHQWWGSLIPNLNDGNYWFVESLAEYSSALYAEFAEPDQAEAKKTYQEKVGDWRRRVLDTDIQASVQDASVLWTGGLFRGYQAAVYNKGPYVFHIMRMTWGKDKFFDFLKMMAQDLRNKAIVTRDIQKEAEKAFGGNMEFFFDQWLRGVGIPEYTFSYSLRQTEDGKYLIEGDIAQRVLMGQKKDLLEGQYFTAIVPITVVGKNGKEYRWPVRVEGPKVSFRFKVEEKPKEVTFNKYGESLAYDVIVKDNS